MAGAMSIKAQKAATRSSRVLQLLFLIREESESALTFSHDPNFHSFIIVLLIICSVSGRSCVITRVTRDRNAPSSRILEFAGQIGLEGLTG